MRSAPGGAHRVESRGVTTVRRNYQMAYTPSGFWSRLITRLIVSVQRWRTIEQIKEESYSLVYWREGIGVVYEGGHFQVESYKGLVRFIFVRLSTSPFFLSPVKRQAKLARVLENCFPCVNSVLERGKKKRNRGYASAFE